MKKGIIGRKLGMTQIFDERERSSPLLSSTQAPALSFRRERTKRTAMKRFSSATRISRKES